jgi:hypothetical protein
MADITRGGAENPATWGAAERLVADEVTLHFASLNRGERGLSLPRKIADRLRQAGLLLPEHNHMTQDVKARGGGGFYSVTTHEGLTVKMARCCARPQPAFMVGDKPANPPATRTQVIACMSCGAILVELSWPNLPVLS